MLNMESHICGESEVPSDISAERRASMPSESRLIELADFFKNFADGTRIKILFAIDKESLCVCEIAGALNMTNSAVSHQLKMLRGSNLIKSERRGKNIYYSLADDHVRDIIEKALEHIEEK